MSEIVLWGWGNGDGQDAAQASVGAVELALTKS